MARTMKSKLIVVMVTLASGTALAAPRSQSQPQPLPVPVGVACRDVPETENHLAVLMGANNVLRIEALRAGVANPDLTVPAGDGARVVIGMRAFTTPGWLQQIVNCHLARVAAAGPARASTSPLDIPGARARVFSGMEELFIDITSTDSAVGREILARARALPPPA